MEQLKNRSLTSLNGAINSSVTSLTVTSATDFPTSGDFSILIDTELMRVTGVSGTTFTVSRGAEGTTAASHSSGAAVYGVISKAVLENLYKEINQVGTTRPSVARAGTTFMSEDIDLAWNYDGTNWNLVKPCYVPYADRIDVSTWTDLNIGSHVWTDYNGVAVVEQASEAQLRGKYKNVPSAPYTITIAIGPAPYQEAQVHQGILLYDSGSGKCSVVGRTTFSNGDRVAVLDYTNTSTLSSTVFTVNANLRPYAFIRFQDDNTNWKTSISVDGQSWTQVHSRARNSFLTPDKIGLVTLRDTTIASGVIIYQTFYSYKES